MTHPAPSSQVDVRPLPPRERHPLIFSAFGALAQGQAMELINDHDPKPLYYQFQAELPGTFSWDYLEQGPDTWRVAITRIAPGQAAGSTCCGSCGGA